MSLPVEMNRYIEIWTVVIKTLTAPDTDDPLFVPDMTH